uniref:DDE Tnp4 domain-containing protein n=1 Tax=Anopheles epiroticus TaxID=199890 RepID=A0A182PNS8_9DIPT
MSKKTFHFILEKIEPIISKLPADKPCICPEERLMALNKEFIPFPSTAAFEKIEMDFSEKWKFPNCIGAITCRRIRIKTPAKSGTQRSSCKKYVSLHLQAVADAGCKFTTVEVGEYGSRSASGLFNTSTLYQLIRLNRLNIPPPKPLSGTSHNVPHVFVGDAGYPLKRNLLRPYTDNEDAEKTYFNEQLSIVRRCVECALGLLVAKWRCLKTELQATPGYAASI